MGCPPLRWCRVQGACAVPCFCSGLFRGHSWVFGLFVSFVQNLPQLRMRAVIFSFFVLCCWRRGVSRGKPCSTASKGPRSQQRVPGPSASHFHRKDTLTCLLKEGVKFNIFSLRGSGRIVQWTSSGQPLPWIKQLTRNGIWGNLQTLFLSVLQQTFLSPRSFFISFIVLKYT